MNLSRVVPAFAAVTLALAALGLGWGCQSYQRGPIGHPQITSLAVGDFRNDTDEAGLSTHLRQKLADAIMTDGSVRLKDKADAQVVLQGRIKQYALAARAGTQIPSKRDDDKNRDAYQTSIYQASVTVEFEVVAPARKRPVIAPSETVGTVLFDRLPDMNVSRDEALRRATQDAAQQVVAAVVEAW
jgi:hypothetical protein